MDAHLYMYGEYQHHLLIIKHSMHFRSLRFKIIQDPNTYYYYFI